MAIDNAHLLIKSKISRPLLRDSIVLRPRLIELLNHGLDYPLNLVCAGAGFGKTTLVSSWINELTSTEIEKEPNTPLTAWLTLEDHESDLHQFLHYFIAAIRSVVPGACEETLRLLEYRREPPAELLLTILENDLLCLPDRTILVLDDYHMIRRSPVHEFITGLLQHRPPTLHLVLISRYTPPLPIARLRARGDLVEIRNHDLRFLAEEVHEYVRRTWPVMLSHPEMKMLEQKTEGWIAGMQLASLSLRTTDNVETALQSFSASNVVVADFMADEILARQPATFQSFLLKTSILDQFTVSLCTAIGASDDPNWSDQSILDWLLHGNLFITSLDNDQNWYRFHALFRDFLHQRLLTRVSAGEVDNLHRKAARWYANERAIDQAIDHALQASDPGLAAEIMESGLVIALNREDRQSLDRWLNLLPEEIIENRPGLLLMKAWHHHFAGQLDAVLHAIQKAEVLLEQREKEDESPEFRQILRGLIAELRAQDVYCRGLPAQSIIHCREALALLPRSWTYARGGVILYLALSMQAIGDGDAIEAEIIELYEALPNKTDGYALRLLMGLCLVYLQSGRLVQLEETARHLLNQATQSNLVVVQGWGHYFLGMVHYQWNHMDAAEDHFHEILALRYRAHMNTARQGMAGLARVKLALGRDDEAGAITDDLSQLDIRFDGHLTKVTQSHRARVACANGRFEEALKWAKSFTAPFTLRDFVDIEFPQLTKAQILLNSRTWEDRSQALQILEVLYETAEKTHNVCHMIEILATSAIALARQGKISDARENLQQAVAMARAGGFVRVFVDLGPGMHNMLSTLDIPISQSEFLHQILDCFPLSHRQIPQFPGQVPKSNSESSSEVLEIVEQLTARETQVLILLREPISTKELAGQLNISYATVKRHTINVYGKLGVNSRWEAVAKAEKFGILPPR